MKLNGFSNGHIQNSLGIKNITQVKTWWRWYRNGEHYRFNQPVGKQYSYGKGTESETVEETLDLQVRVLKQELELLKKYMAREREWFQK